MPTFLPQARANIPQDNRIANHLLMIGDSVGDAIKGGRQTNALARIAAAREGGDLNHLAKIATQEGALGTAQNVNALIQRQDENAQRQSNADRSFGLQERQFEAGQANAAENRKFRQDQFGFQKMQAEREFNFKKNQSDRNFRLQLKALERKNQKLENVLTPGQKKADQEFAKEYVEFTASGGFADVEKQLGQIDKVAGQLEAGDKNLTGAFVGSIPDWVNVAFGNQDAVTVREQVEEVVQRNLRLVLGAQFTQKEGDRLIKRAFNPLLDEKENARRVRNLIGQMKTAAQQMQAASEYFQQNGTIVGFEGKLPSFSDFTDTPETGNATAEQGPPKAGSVVEGYRFKGGDPASQSSWERVE